MGNPTVKISERAHRTLKELSRHSGRPMQDILDTAIEAERRRQFLEAANASYLKVTDPAQLEEELRLWEATLMDGLETET